MGDEEEKDDASNVSGDGVGDACRQYSRTSLLTLILSVILESFSDLSAMVCCSSLVPCVSVNISSMWVVCIVGVQSSYSCKSISGCASSMSLMWDEEKDGAKAAQVKEEAEDVNKWSGSQALCVDVRV